MTRLDDLIQKLPEIDIKDQKGLREEILSLAKDLTLPETLIPYLESEHYLIRESAVDALGMINHTESVRALVHLLDQETRKEVQMAAVYALQAITSFTALEAVLNLARSNQHSQLVRSLAVQATAVLSLKLVVEPLFQILTEAIADDNTPLLESVFDAFQMMGDQTEDSISAQLLELLRETNTPASVKPYVITALGERRYSPAFETILALLDSESSDLQRAAAIALGQLGIPAAIAKLETMHEHEDDIVRYHVEQALMRLRH